MSLIITDILPVFVSASLSQHTRNSMMIMRRTEVYVWAQMYALFLFLKGLKKHVEK